MRNRVSCFVASILVASSACSAEEVNFNRDIRPLLSDRCFHCHGPDAAHREADLRLDTAEGAMTDLGGHAAIVPGKPEESELYRRIISTDVDERMPPEDDGDPLSKEEAELLRRWIEQGAKYEAHWSFVAPRPSQAPTNDDATWPRNEIDHFVKDLVG